MEPASSRELLCYTLSRTETEAEEQHPGDQIEEICAACSGVPLTLIVIGSTLRDRTEPSLARSTSQVAPAEGIGSRNTILTELQAARAAMTGDEEDRLLRRLYVSYAALSGKPLPGRAPVSEKVCSVSSGTFLQASLPQIEHCFLAALSWPVPADTQSFRAC